ncbi:MAG: pyrroline-5-carboxylate reductase [Clostridia bacterium]|nr:pyrroline-5-carboxylate reductase [Clostridia bacterium]
MNKISFIGVGNLASAMLKGVVESGLAEPENIIIFDIDKSKTVALNVQYGVNVASSAVEAAAAGDVSVVAVKPKDIDGVLGEISSGASFVISTAAGVELSSLKANLRDDCAVARIMPNINASVGKAMTAYCVSPETTAEQISFLNDFCQSFGKCISLEEKYFPVFTAVAGSAPAFVYEFINDLAFGAVKNGLPKSTALEIAAQTVLGSAQMIIESGVHPCELTDRVCSPAGTTVEGVAALREFGFDNAVIKAVDYTVNKDKKLK